MMDQLPEGDGIPNYVDYLYDAFGRRIAAIYPDDISGVGTSSGSYITVYDGVAPVQKRSFYTNNSITEQYYYGLGINNLVLVRANGTNYLPISDDRGTIVGVAATDGTIQETLYYNSTGLCHAFDINGDLKTREGVTTLGRSEFIPFGWCGMYRDEFTGLYHTHFRDYDALHGRWLIEDPAGYADGLNLYNAYMGVNGVDPLGLDVNSLKAYARYFGDKVRDNPWQLLNPWSDVGIVGALGAFAYTGFTVPTEINREAHSLLRVTVDKRIENPALKTFVKGVSYTNEAAAHISFRTTEAAYGYAVGGQLLEIGLQLKYVGTGLKVVGGGLTTAHSATGIYNLATNPDSRNVGYIIDTAGSTFAVAYMTSEYLLVRVGENGIVPVAIENISVETPYGNAVQSTKYEALEARQAVNSGAMLYRLGTIGKSAAGEAQFWALEHPYTDNYASKFGIPVQNIINADFIEVSVIKQNGNFVTRPAPGIGENVGGGIEVVVPEYGVTLQSFSTK